MLNYWKKREWARKKVKLFSFNIGEDESDLQKAVAEFRESEKQGVLNESTHIDSIVAKSKFRSALLRPGKGFIGFY